MVKHHKPCKEFYFILAVVKKRSWAFAVLFFILNISWAQNNQSSLSFYDLYFKSPTLVNPSEVDVHKTFTGYLGNRSLTGAFAGVHRTFADLSFMTNKLNSTNKTKHFLGTQVSNNRDGAYFQRNRFYLRYSLSIALSNELRLQSGVSVGAVNYIFQSSTAGSGDSDFTPDANLGLSLQHENFSVGIAGQQLFSSPIRPVEYTYYLKPYYTATASIGKDLTPFVRLNAFSVVEIHPSDEQTLFQLSGTLNYQEVFEGGVGYNQQKGVFVLAGIPQLKLSEWYLNLNISYLVYNTKSISTLIDRSIEVSLGIVLPR